jgi:hypothetical protein
MANGLWRLVLGDNLSLSPALAKFHESILIFKELFMPNVNKSFSISISDLWTYNVKNVNKRLSLNYLPENGLAHIHGRLEIYVAGRLLPYLGYFGPDDVCFGSWTEVLIGARNELASADNSEFEYDEGEQGQPIFKFSREGSSIFVSIVESHEHPGDPDWQRVECSLEDLISAIDAYLKLLEKTVSSASPVGGRNWLKRYNVI